MKKFVRYYLPVMLFAALLYTISSVHKLPTPHIGITFYDKIGHLGAYTIFCLLTLRALEHESWVGNRLLLYLLTIGFMVVYGILDEYHQSFVPGRESDWYDVIADSAGGLLGVLVHLWWRKSRKVQS